MFRPRELKLLTVRTLAANPLPRLAMMFAFVCGAVRAGADEPIQRGKGALSADDFVRETSWDEGAIASGATELSPNEAALARRVEALERILRERGLDGVEQAAGEEQLPDKPNKKDDKPDPTLPKKIDIITKPTFTPIGRIYFDGVTYTDDEATKEFFSTDRDNELGFRIFRIGGKGYIYENLYYNMEIEIRGTNSAIKFTDIY